MAKQRLSPEKRKNKLSDFFKSKPDQAFQVKELKVLLSNKDEPTLRRDLDDLVKENSLKKSKDTSVYPNRAYYQNSSKSKKAVAASKTSESPPAKQSAATAKKVKASKTGTKKPTNKTKLNPSKAARPTIAEVQTSIAAASQPATSKAAPKAKTKNKPAKKIATKSNPLGKRAAARELEARIIEMVKAQPATVSEITTTLNRQRPTIVKALERLSENGTLTRTSDKRPFYYSIASDNALKTQVPTAVSPAPVKVSSAQNTANLSLEESPGVAQVTVNAILDRLLASERRLWELEQKK